MKPIRTTVLTTTCGALFAALPAPAAAAPVSVNLLQPDDYAARGVVVTKTDGSVVRGVLAITAYDQATKSFVLETAAQGATTVPAASVRDFAFSRVLQRSSPQAQTCPSETIETAGPPIVVEIPAKDLRIERDVLLAELPRGGAQLAAGTRVEARSLQYDAAGDLFRAALQTVAYRIETAACGGASPMGGKGLQ